MEVFPATQCQARSRCFTNVRPFPSSPNMKPSPMHRVWGRGGGERQRQRIGGKEGLRDQRRSNKQRLWVHMLPFRRRLMMALQASLFVCSSWLESPQPSTEAYGAILQPFHLPFGCYERLKPTQQGRGKLVYCKIHVWS